MTFTITLTKRTAILILTAIAALIFATVVTGCSQKEKEQFRDAPISGRDASAAEVYDNPDGFSNFAEKCDKHGNRIIVAFHGDDAYAGITAIAADPSCPKS